MIAYRLARIVYCTLGIFFVLGMLQIPVHAQAGITLNLKDADIRTLIETVAEATGKNFVIDPRVKAKVTVVSSKPMREDEVYQVFLSILQVHGYSAVSVGEVVKIVPDVTAKQGPVSVTERRSPGKGDQLVTRVLAIENVPAAQMVPILRPLVPQQGHLAAYAASNVLVISDRAANISRLEKIISRIDRPESQQIEVIPLEHASASEVVRIVNALSQQTAKKGAQMPGKPILVADERTNSILLGGDKSARLRIRGLIAHLDTPLEGAGNTQVIFLKYAQAEELAPILLGIAQQQQQRQQQRRQGAQAAPAGAARGRQDLDIQADPSNNALIITAPPAIFNNLKSVIDQLDIRREQVLVESIIAAVGTELTRELGAELLLAPVESGSGPAVGINVGGAAAPPSLLEIVQGTLNIGSGLFLGGADLTGGDIFAFLIRALDGDTATNILSTPTLVMLDNEEAQITVAQDVPFITGSFTTQTGETSENPFQTIERQDVGLTLTITPQINEGDSIKLDIEQEVSELEPASTAVAAGASDLITSKRTIKTSVLVENDQILVLGGLMQDRFRDAASKVPLVGDIPLIGRLFRFEQTQKDKENLMLFIHPVILRDERTADAYTGKKYSYYRAQQLDAGVDKRGLIPEGAVTLPDLDELVTKVPEYELKNNPNQDLDAFIDLQ